MKLSDQLLEVVTKSLEENLDYNHFMHATDEDLARPIVTAVMGVVAPLIRNLTDEVAPIAHTTGKGWEALRAAMDALA